MYSYDRTANGQDTQRHALAAALAKTAQGSCGKLAKEVVKQVLAKDPDALGVVYHDMFDRQVFLRELAKSLGSIADELAESMLIELEDRK